MIVFRLTRSTYSSDLSGKGAAFYGGRWNNNGIPVVYTSESRALSLLEAAIHFPLGNLPDDYMMVTLSIPDDITIIHVHADELPEGWNRYPYHHCTRETGDRLLKKMECSVIKVPSAIVQGDFNYLINPIHPESNQISIFSVETFPVNAGISGKS